MSGLSAQEWQVLKPILDQALALETQHQERFLKEKLSSQTHLLAHARSLLRQQTASDGVLDNPLTDLFSQVDADAGFEDLVGTTIGAYQLQEFLGVGGMGVVYKATRQIEDAVQTVAIKVLKPNLDSAAIVQRFLHERRILAALDHPYIARLFDGGQTQDGLPYLVMEYVAGEPLLDYCEEHQLSLDGRLELFQKVCSAVHYAHQNLIVHRDLKPSNILVTAEGEPRLLDFGIAKWLEPEKKMVVPKTRYGWQLLTPEYASPEQFLGEQITTASDIYGLGILLYELLTGLRPFDSGAAPYAELKAAVCCGDLVKPSVRLSQKQAETGRTFGAASDEKQARQLRGDLDTIVLTAMQREMARRYNSAAQLSSDIQLFRTGRMIQARPETWRYVMAKFIQRNRMALSFAAGIVALVVVFAGFLMAQNKRLRTAVIRAQNEYQRAQMAHLRSSHVSQFLTNIFIAADPYESNLDQVTAKTLLRRGAEDIANDANLPAKVKAELQHTMGRIYLRTGMLAEAEPLLMEALAMTSQVHAPKAKVLLTLYQTLGHFYFESGNFDLAETYLQKALRGFEEDSDKIWQEIADVEAVLGDVYRARGEYKRALQNHQRAFELNEKHNPSNRSALTLNLSQMSSDYYRLGDYKESVALLERALEILVEDPQLPIEKAGIQDELAKVYRKWGRYKEAETVFKEALALKTEAFGPASLWVSDTQNGLALLYMRMGEYARAEAMFQNVLNARQKILRPENPDMAIAKNNLANTLLLTGRFSQAKQFYLEALAIREGHFGRCHTKYAETLNNLGQVALGEKNLEQAGQLLNEAHAIRDFILGSDHIEPTRVRYYLGDWHLAMGRVEEAEQCFQDVLGIFTAKYGPKHLTVGCTLSKLGEIYGRLGRLELAGEYLGGALTILSDSLGRDHPFTGETYIALGDLLAAGEDWQQASWWYAEAYEVLLKKSGASHPRTHDARKKLQELEAQLYQEPQYAFLVQQLERLNPIISDKQGN